MIILNLQPIGIFIISWIDTLLWIVLFNGCKMENLQKQQKLLKIQLQNLHKIHKQK